LVSDKSWGAESPRCEKKSTNDQISGLIRLTACRIITKEVVESFSNITTL